MKTEVHILVALLANALLAAIELIGGLIVGSFALVSDSLHSLGDSATIAISFFLELKSKRPADKRHSFGYARYSMLGGLLTNMFLLVGSFTMLMHSIHGLIEPHAPAYGGMLVLALVGAGANLIAAIATRSGRSSNEKAVSLHAVQDVLTHLSIVIGAIIIKYTGFMQIDAVLSILIAIFIFCHALHHLKESLAIFLDIVPEEIDPEEIEDELLQIKGLLGFHHLHIWSLDGKRHCASLHVLAKSCDEKLKNRIRELFKRYGVEHVTIEIELDQNCCKEHECRLKSAH